jgi:glycosyltransferase involved in cell wall biosynthesis
MVSPLKVLVVSHTAEVWGAEVQLLEVAPWLAEMGVELTLAGPSEGPFADSWAALRLPTLRYEVLHHQGLRRPDGSGRRPGLAASAQELATVARSAAAVASLARPFDLLQVHTLAAAPEVTLAGHWVRRPSVIDLHDIVVPGLGRQVLRLASRLATLTIANSRATAATLGGGRSGKRLSVVYPSVDVSRFRPGPPDRTVRAALAGHVEDPEKGVHHLVRAVAALDAHRPGVQLAIVGAPLRGAGEYYESLRNEASSLLGDRVRFVGARSDIPEVLRSIDLLVNASANEPFGRSVLEAQACGTPVVGTSAGGIPEFVEDNQSGLLVPPGDVVALTDALERFFGDPGLYDRCRKAGISQALALSAEAQSTKLCRLYRSVVGGRRRPRAGNADSSP